MLADPVLVLAAFQAGYILYAITLTKARVRPAALTQDLPRGDDSVSDVMMCQKKTVPGLRTFADCYGVTHRSVNLRFLCTLSTMFILTYR